MTVANTHARLLMTNGFRRPVEHEIAEVGMGIQAPDVGRTEFHQHLVRSARIAGVSEFNRFGDRIRVGIVRIHTGQDLLISNAGRGPRGWFVSPSRRWARLARPSTRPVDLKCRGPRLRSGDPGLSVGTNWGADRFCSAVQQQRHSAPRAGVNRVSGLP
jgi:hypothetical protein